VLGAYTRVFALTTHPERTRGLSTAFGVELRGVGAMTVRFTEGASSVEEPGAPVDATVSAEPIAFLLVGSGRLDRFEAIALGLLEPGGPRPDLALGFFDLFVFP
jgi:putative sterol carrier protein